MSQFLKFTINHYFTASPCSSLRRNFMKCSIINPTLSLFMKHLVIDQRQKAPNFLAFHWSTRSSLVSIGQHFIITLVVSLPKRTETSLITEAGLITKLYMYQAVRALHSCNSWLLPLTVLYISVSLPVYSSGSVYHYHFLLTGSWHPDF